MANLVLVAVETEGVNQCT